MGSILSGNISDVSNVSDASNGSDASNVSNTSNGSDASNMPILSDEHFIYIEATTKLRFHYLERELSAYWSVLLKTDVAEATQIVNLFTKLVSVNFRDESLAAGITVDTFDKHIREFMNKNKNFAESEYMELLEEIVKCVKKITMLYSLPAQYTK